MNTIGWWLFAVFLGTLCGLALIAVVGELRHRTNMESIREQGVAFADMIEREQITTSPAELSYADDIWTVDDSHALRIRPVTEVYVGDYELLIRVQPSQHVFSIDAEGDTVRWLPQRRPQRRAR